VQTRHRFYVAPVRSATGLADSISEAMPRDDARLPVLVTAALVFLGDRDEAWCCTVRDVSKGGARIELDRAKPPRVSEQLPDLVLLHLCPDLTEVECRVIWRDGRHFGVQFIGEVRPSTRLPL
jgi:hypothetical protein